MTVKTYARRIVGAVACCIALIGSMAGCDVFERNAVPAAQAAKDFMTDLQLPDAGAACSWDAAKLDVLATCTVSLDRGSDFPPLLFSIDCAPKGSTLMGCRATPDVLKLLMDAKIVLTKKRPAPGTPSAAPSASAAP